MKRATTTATGLASLVVLLALGALVTGSASAHEFRWTGPLPALILVLNDNPQIFTAEPGGLAIECKHFGGHGKTPATGMSATVVTISGKYSKCEVKGTGLGATVTEAQYEISAEGTVTTVGNPIVITIPSAGCSIKITSGGANTNLALLLFLNKTSDLLVHAAIGGIHSNSSGGSCGTAGVEKEKGTYFGLLLVWIDGGTVVWA